MSKIIFFLVFVFFLAACASSDLQASSTPSMPSATAIPAATETPHPTGTLTPPPPTQKPTPTLEPTPTEMPAPTPTVDAYVVPSDWQMINREKGIAVNDGGVVMEHNGSDWVELGFPADINEEFTDQFRLEIGENNLPTIKINFLEMGDLEIAEYVDGEWQLKEFDFRYSPERINEMNGYSTGWRYQTRDSYDNNGIIYNEYQKMFFSGLRVTLIDNQYAFEMLASHKGGYTKIRPNAFVLRRDGNKTRTDLSITEGISTTELNDIVYILGIMNTSSRIVNTGDSTIENGMILAVLAVKEGYDDFTALCEDNPYALYCGWNGYGDVRFANPETLHRAVLDSYSYEDLSGSDWDSFPSMPQGTFVSTYLNDKKR